MYYSLVNFPDIDKNKLDSFREKYDPLKDIIDFHITLLFPIKIPEEISEKELISHIESKLGKYNSFKVELEGLEKSWDHWLFLLLKEGNLKVIELHDELYSGVLAKFLRKDIKFIPHVSIGFFGKKDSNYDLKDPQVVSLDEVTYKKAITECKKLNLNYNYKFDKLSLVKLDDDLKNCELVKEFILN